MVETVTDYVLIAIFCFGGYLKSPYSVNKTMETLGDLFGNYNYQTIKRALQNLNSKGLLLKSGGGLKISPAGKEKVLEILPGLNAQNKRKQGEIFLITYDICEASKYGRQNIMRFLKRSGVYQVQESVYLTTKDLRSELSEIIESLHIKGAVLVAKLGADSFFGDKTTKEYLSKIYKLDDLNDRYCDFIDFIKKPSQKLSRLHINFLFNRIFKNDSRLPDEFLPDNWHGKEALKLYQKLTF